MKSQTMRRVLAATAMCMAIAGCATAGSVGTGSSAADGGKSSTATAATSPSITATASAPSTAGFGTYSTREVCENIDTSAIDVAGVGPVTSPLVRPGNLVECEQKVTVQEASGPITKRHFYLEAFAPASTPSGVFRALETSHDTAVGAKSKSTILYRTVNPFMTLVGVRQQDGAAATVEVFDYSDSSKEQKVERAIAFADGIAVLQQQSPKESYVATAPEPTTDKADIFINADGGLDPCSVLGSPAVAPQPGEKGPRIGSLGTPEIKSTDAGQLSPKINFPDPKSPDWQVKTETCTLTMQLNTGPETLSLGFSFNSIRASGTAPEYRALGFDGVECGFSAAGATTQSHAYICKTQSRPGAEIEGSRYITLSVPQTQFPAESLSVWLPERMKLVLQLMDESGHLNYRG